MPRWFPYNPRKLWAAIRLADPPFEASPKDQGAEAVAVLHSIVGFLGLMGRDTPAGSVLLSDAIPVDDAQLHHTTRLPKKRVHLALHSLSRRGFVVLRGEEIIVTERTVAILQPDPEDVAHATRQRTYRERAASRDGNVTGHETVTVANAEKSREEESREYPPSPAETSGTAPGKPPQPRQTRLVDPAVVRAGEILGLLWPRVSTAVGSAMTKTRWGQINKAAALDMARVGLDDATIVAAHDRLCERRGEAVYTLSWIQDEIAKGSAAVDPTDKLPMIFAPGTRRGD